MKIVDGKQEGLWWNAGDKGTRKRKSNEPIQSIVWHWTAGEGKADAICRSLKNAKRKVKTKDASGNIVEALKPRPLSIHFTIDVKGVITQHRDPVTTIAYHASAMNSYAIGVEIANSALTKVKNINGRLPRDCIVKGEKRTYYDFLPAQYEAVKWLASYLSSMYQIPKEVLKENKLYDLSFLKNYRGHLEHLHCSEIKVDSGGFIMQALEEYFRVVE